MHFHFPRPKRPPPPFMVNFFRWAGLWLPLVGIAAVPVLTDWLDNRYQALGEDLVFPLILNLITATLIALGLSRWYRRQKLGALISGTSLVLLLTNNYESRLSQFYPFINSLNPLAGQLGSSEGLIVSLVFIAICTFLAYLIGRVAQYAHTNSSWPHADWSGGLRIVLLVIFLLKAVPVGSAIITEWQQIFYRPPQLPALSTSASTDKPDVYYIVLDRYASQDVLTSQFNYDNSSFLNFLNQEGYSVNNSAHQNYPYTAMSIASTMLADYETDMVQKFGNVTEQSYQPFFNTIRFSPVAQEFQSIGYKYYELGNEYETSNVSPLADYSYQQDGILTLFGRQFVLNTFGKAKLAQSIWFRPLSEGLEIAGHSLISYSTQDRVDDTLSQFTTLKSIAAQPAGGKFVFAHILVPHDPYFFNADGSLKSPEATGADNQDEAIKSKYVDNLEFANTQMEQVLDAINKGSNGKAVVILQSDEGPHPQELNDGDFNAGLVEDSLGTGSMLDWSDADLQMKFGNLAAYHIPAASSNDLAVAGDNVNVFRLVFNDYFNGSFAYLPRCYYAYGDGRQTTFDYVNINQKLTGQANNQCPADSNFSNQPSPDS